MKSMIVGVLFCVVCLAVLRWLLTVKCNKCGRIMHRDLRLMHAGMCPICHYITSLPEHPMSVELLCDTCGQSARNLNEFLVIDEKVLCEQCLEISCHFSICSCNRYLYSERKPPQMFLVPAFGVFCCASVWAPILLLIGFGSGMAGGNIQDGLRISVGLSQFVFIVALVFSLSVYTALRLWDCTHLVATNGHIYEMSVYGERYQLAAATCEETEQRVKLWPFCRFLPWGYRKMIVLRFIQQPQRKSSANALTEREFHGQFNLRSEKIWMSVLSHSRPLDARADAK